VGVSAADHHGAALLAMGVLAALFRRATTGKGCRVDVNLLSAAIDLQNESFTCFLNGPRPASVTPQQFSGGWYFAAPYGIFPTADGHLAISSPASSRLQKRWPRRGSRISPAPRNTTGATKSTRSWPTR